MARERTLPGKVGRCNVKNEPMKRVVISALPDFHAAHRDAVPVQPLPTAGETREAEPARTLDAFSKPSLFEFHTLCVCIYIYLSIYIYINSHSIVFALLAGLGSLACWTEMPELLMHLANLVYLKSYFFVCSFFLSLTFFLLLFIF